MRKPAMYAAIFHLYSGQTVTDDFGWIDREEEPGRSKIIRINICDKIREGEPFWTYSKIIFPDTVRLVEFFWRDDDE